MPARADHAVQALVVCGDDADLCSFSSAQQILHAPVVSSCIDIDFLDRCGFMAQARRYGMEAEDHLAFHCYRFFLADLAFDWEERVFFDAAEAVFTRFGLPALAVAPPLRAAFGLALFSVSRRFA